MFTEWLQPAFDATKNGGALLCFCIWHNADEWRRAIEGVGYTVKSQVIWDRMHHGMGDLKGAFAPQHDIIWYAVKGRRIFANSRPKSVLRYKRPSPSQDFGHPTCKPVELMKDLLHSTCDGTKGLVVDPFLGSGSTGVAAVELGRPFSGCELDPDYFKIAEDRINAAEKA